MSCLYQIPSDCVIYPWLAVQLALIFAHTEKYPDEPPLLNVKRFAADMIIQHSESNLNI